MSRFAPVVPAALLALALTACSAGGGGGGVHGTPGGAGVRDPYFAKAGNGGYDVGHYDLRLSYDPARRHLTGTAQLTATANDANGTTLSHETFLWSSSDSDKASVSASGVVTGKRQGDVTITAQASSAGGKRGSVDIEVKRK